VRCSCQGFVRAWSVKEDILLAAIPSRDVLLSVLPTVGLVISANALAVDAE